MKRTAQADPDLQKIIRNITGGDKEQFRLIISRYKPLVIHLVCRMIRDRYEQEDLCQEIFLKVYTHLHTFRFDSRMSTWIGRIAHNTCLNHLQKRGESLYDDSGDAMLTGRITSDLPEPDTRIMQEDSVRALEEAMGNLAPVFRSVLTLYHLEHMSYEEISKITALPAGTVKSYLFRARKKLRELLETRYAEELL